ncbi:MAG: carbonic anhydrase [Propionibacteriaceae bacterium]|jgi:carbonic anhydrase|nr:carbonic anhydrase [Propionibacteriaceae bacterium]
MGDFDDLLAANRRFANSAPRNFDGYAHGGLQVVTCMDSRLLPLEMIGLFVGEAKILRTPGGHVTPEVVSGCVMGVHLLRVNRIVVVGHTRCAVASQDSATLRRRIVEAAGFDRGEWGVDGDTDQLGRLRSDAALLREHPMIVGRALVGAFMYDVDSGLLEQVA